jgi:hypothetical protein
VRHMLTHLKHHQGTRHAKQWLTQKLGLKKLWVGGVRTTC